MSPMTTTRGKMVERKHLGIVVLSRRLKIDPGDLDRLRDAGYVPIIGKPDDVKVVLPDLSTLDGNQITVAALKTIAINDQRKTDFGKIILASLMAEIGGG